MAVKGGQKIAQITVAGANVVINGIQEMSKSDIERAVNTSVVAVDYYKETGKMLSFEEQVKIQAQDQGITLSKEDLANAMNQLIEYQNYSKPEYNNEKNENTIHSILGENSADIIIRGLDGRGNGEYESNRDHGLHTGIDIKVYPKTPVYAIEDGLLISTSPQSIKNQAYKDAGICDIKSSCNYAAGAEFELKAIKLQLKDGVEINMFYVEMFGQQRNVKKGDLIGHAQDMSSIYNYVYSNEPYSMTNHIHLEIKYSNINNIPKSFQDPKIKMKNGKFNYYYDNPKLRYSDWNMKIENNYEKNIYYKSNKK